MTLTPFFDPVLWQLLQQQLCFARRLYRERRQPNLDTSNFKSVVGAVRYFREQTPDSIPLISDLTTFVQIGDVLLMDPEKGMSIIEVKEGAKNEEAGRLAAFYRQSQCEQFRQFVSEKETKHTVKQFERMVRQMERMEFATDVLGKGRGKDPDTDQKIFIPEPYMPMVNWDRELDDLFNTATERGWAINVIDNCLFVGCYADQQMRMASPYVFLSWFDKYAQGGDSRLARLIDGMTIPLALPPFTMRMHKGRKMDVMFGRLHVCMGISTSELVKECEKHGIVARKPNKAERRVINGDVRSLVKYNGHPLVLERNGKSMILADGVFMRCMFHLQRPISLISGMLDITYDDTEE